MLFLIKIAMKNTVILAFLFIGLYGKAQQVYVETFDNSTELNSSYKNIEFVGLEGINYSCVQCAYLESNAIEGRSVILRNANSSLEATYPSGISALSFQYRKAFSGASARRIKVYLNDTLVDEIGPFGLGSGVEATVYDYEMSSEIFQNIDMTNGVTLKITAVNTSNNYQVTIDNLSWTPIQSLSLDKENVSNRLVLFPNPTSEFISIDGMDEEVEKFRIFDVSGKKILEGNYQSTIDVIHLESGTYFIELFSNDKVINRSSFVKK